MLGATQCQGCSAIGISSSYALDNLTSTRLFSNNTNFREVIGVIKLVKDSSNHSSVKKALLSAKKKERIKLPDYGDSCTGKSYAISEFLNHPTGVEAILNVNALESWQSLGSNTYRCRLPVIQLLNFGVAPVVDLQVKRTSEECTVELLSCKFEGSDIVERQSKYFSASMKNYITWDTNNMESFLDVDVKLDVSLEIYSQPFILLPVSAVEGPGNIALQALLDRLVPLLLQQLVWDYDNWVQQQSGIAP